jgi:hypothetical protein
MIPCSMDFGDKFSNFVVNELIDSLSLDDDDNFYFDAANIVVEVSQNEPIHRGSIVGHHTVDRDRLSWHYILYRDYFSENPIFGPDLFRRRLVRSLKIWLLLSCMNVFHCG